MKTSKILALICAVLFSVSFASAQAPQPKPKDIKEITFKIEKMNDAKAEKEVVHCLKDVKGIEKVDTNLKAKTVEIKYDSDVTSASKISTLLEKNKFKVAPVLPTPDPKKDDHKK